MPVPVGACCSLPAASRQLPPAPRGAAAPQGMGALLSDSALLGALVRRYLDGAPPGGGSGEGGLAAPLSEHLDGLGFDWILVTPDWCAAASPCGGGHSGVQGG